MKTQLKQKRKGFAGYAIMAAIALTATSVVMLPNIEHKRDKHLAEELQKKEKILYDVYKSYFNGIKFDNADLAQNCKDLAKKAQEAGIINAVTEGELCTNGYGDDIRLSAAIPLNSTSVTFTINPDLKNATAQRFYAGFKATNENLDVADRDSKDYSKNVYSFDSRSADDVRRQDVINKDRADKQVEKKIAKGQNISTDNTDTSKEWYEYDKNTDLFAVKEYVNGAWVNKKDEKGEPIYKSAGGQGADGKYYVESRDDKEANSVGEGARLVELNDDEAIEYIAGRVRKKDANGNDIADSYELGWLAVKAESEDTPYAEVPSSVDVLNDMLNRDSTQNYYKGNLGAFTELKYMWGVDITIAKYENFWRTISKVEVPSYTDTSTPTTHSRYVYIAPDLESLPLTDNEEGDLAFLMMNNEAGVGKGYKALHNTTNETLYPEAIYYDNEWILYAPTVSNMLENGLNSYPYVTEEQLYRFNTGGFENSYQWRYGAHKSTDITFLISKGKRIDFPEIKSDKYKDTELFLTVGINPDATTRTSVNGVKSTFFTSITLYDWLYIEDTDARVINSLTDELPLLP